MDRTKQLIEELEFNELDELPEDIREAIKEAEVAYGKSEGSVELPSGQPYRLSDADDFPFGTYIQNKTGRIVSKHFRMSDEYFVKQDKGMGLIKELGFTEIFNRSFYGAANHSATIVYEKRMGNSITLVSFSNVIKKWVKKVKRKYKESYGLDIHVYSNDDTEEYTSLIEKIIGLGTRRKFEENNIALVIQTPRGYSTTSFELPKQKLDIELNYGSKFKAVHEKIITRLNQKKGKGLVLLHGTPGTGKTHYLKYLASKIKDKKVMFIPPFLADFITSPEMTPFLNE